MSEYPRYEPFVEENILEAPLGTPTLDHRSSIIGLGQHLPLRLPTPGIFNTSDIENIFTATRESNSKYDEAHCHQYTTLSRACAAQRKALPPPAFWQVSGTTRTVSPVDLRAAPLLPIRVSLAQPAHDEQISEPSGPGAQRMCFHAELDEYQSEKKHEKEDSQTKRGRRRDKVRKRWGKFLEGIKDLRKSREVGGGDEGLKNSISQPIPGTFSRRF